MCVERVAADLMGLTSAVATALKRELKSGDVDDEALVKQWCEFYSEELLPDTKKFVKKTSSKLDVYGLYLPSRMSASLPQELLEKGLKLGGNGGEESKSKDDAEEDGTASAVEEKEEANDESDDGEGDVSLAMSSNKEEEDLAEDEYDEEYYDEYDEEE